MTSLNELIYDIWQIINPIITDDGVIDERQIAYWIANQRSLWLHRELNKGFRTFDDNIIQSLGAVEFEIVDSIENNPYTGGGKVLKSKVKIPVAIELNFGTAITRIAPLDIKCKPFKLIDYNTVPFAGHGKFNQDQIFAFLKGGYMYLTSGCNNPFMKSIKYVNIMGVFENPEEVGRFKELDGSSCWTYDSPYPINKWMIDYLKAEIIKSDLKFFIRPILDESNDANPQPTNTANEEK